MKIINVVGARPNFMKIAPLMTAYKKQPSFLPLLLHTGQHYDSQMSELFFTELNIPKPDIYLNIGSDTHAKQVAKIMVAFEDVCIAEKPDAILVVGDVNSTMACSIVASKLGIKIIHLEAGLRSFDRTMPEEINRLVTDTLADMLLIPSVDAKENLLKEGVDESKIHFVGNIMIDTLFNLLPVIEKSDIHKPLNLTPQDYILVTLHRPSNVDDFDNLKNLLVTLNEVSEKIKVVFPIHPRTIKNINNYKLSKYLDRIIHTEPLGYIDFQKLMTNARLVVTDSGGVQEETTALGIPCLTARENTERPVTISEGTNIIIGNNMSLLINGVENAINNNWKKSNVPEFWDGKTAERVVNTILNSLR